MNKNQSLDYCGFFISLFRLCYVFLPHPNTVRKKHQTLCSIETTLQSLVLERDRDFIPWLLPKLQK